MRTCSTSRPGVGGAGRVFLPTPAGTLLQSLHLQPVKPAEGGSVSSRETQVQAQLSTSDLVPQVPGTPPPPRTGRLSRWLAQGWGRLSQPGTAVLHPGYTLEAPGGGGRGLQNIQMLGHPLRSSEIWGAAQAFGFFKAPGSSQCASKDGSRWLRKKLCSDLTFKKELVKIPGSNSQSFLICNRNSFSLSATPRKMECWRTRGHEAGGRGTGGEGNVPAPEEIKVPQEKRAIGKEIKPGTCR